MAASSALLPSLLTLLLIAAKGAAPAVAAPPRAIPCDPPLDRPLQLRMTQRLWSSEGRAVSITVGRSLRFSRDGDGFRVSAHIATLDTDEPGRQAHDRMHLAYGAPGDVPVVVRLDAAMRITGIESLDARWADFRQRQARLARSMAAEGAGQRAAALGAMLDAMAPAEQIAMLSAFLAPVLHHCGGVMPADATQAPDGILHMEKVRDSAQMRDVSRYSVDPRTGLLRVLDRNLTTISAPLRPLREHWTLDPEN